MFKRYENKNNSNTTLVKVKLTGGNPDFIYGQNSNTTLVKVKLELFVVFVVVETIQIQLLLKLNKINNNTENVPLTFKYNSC